MSMIFGYKNHPVDQKKIVQDVFGAVVCSSSGLPQNSISKRFNKNWIDDDGKPFKARLAGVFDAYAGMVAINNAMIMTELANDNPLLIMNTHHAMVLCAIDYIKTAAGDQIQSLYVVDPWPGQGIHALPTIETVPVPRGQCTFIAAVHIT
jgi:hypothetical protein